jgi:hypothetical protein
MNSPLMEETEPIASGSGSDKRYTTVI